MTPPNVGENLQDHLDVVFDYEVNTKDVFGLGFGAVGKLLKASSHWRKDGTGLLSTNFAESGAFLMLRMRHQRVGQIPSYILLFLE